jgi:hypothetical protein
MSNSVKLLFGLFAIGLLSVSCSNSSEEEQSQATTPLKSITAIYDLVLGFNQSKQVGTIQGSTISLAQISMPASFVWDSMTYEVVSTSTIGDIDGSNNSNLYLVVEVTNATTSESEVFAAPLVPIDPAKSLSFGINCPNETHSCSGNNCNSCSFSKNLNGCITGCTCLSQLASQVDGTCDHTVSTGGSTGSTLHAVDSPFLVRP